MDDKTKERAKEIARVYSLKEIIAALKECSGCHVVVTFDAGNGRPPPPTPPPGGP